MLSPVCQYFTLYLWGSLSLRRGFWGGYVKEYIEASNPAFCIGEYWDSLAYEGGTPAYNQSEWWSLINQLLLTRQHRCCLVAAAAAGIGKCST